jgi:hypothetical protein
LVAVVVGGLISGIVAPWGPVVAVAAVVAWLAMATYFARSVAPVFETTTPNVVLAFACLHAGYGIGTWMGLLRFAPRWVIDRRGDVPRLSPQTS